MEKRQTGKRGAAQLRDLSCLLRERQPLRVFLTVQGLPHPRVCSVLAQVIYLAVGLTGGAKQCSRRGLVVLLVKVQMRFMEVKE